MSGPMEDRRMEEGRMDGRKDGAWEDEAGEGRGMAGEERESGRKGAWMDRKHIWWVRKDYEQRELKFHLLALTGDGTLGQGWPTCIHSSPSLTGEEEEQSLRGQSTCSLYPASIWALGCWQQAWHCSECGSSLPPSPDGRDWETKDSFSREGIGLPYAPDTGYCPGLPAAVQGRERRDQGHWDRTAPAFGEQC